MAVIDLQVFICSKPAGIVHQDDAGLASFQYDDDYQGIPLSLSMPISNRRYGHDVVRPFLFGLLPDIERQRRAIASEYDVSPNNPVALLEHIGLDCPGGVQFCRVGEESILLARKDDYRPLSDHEITLKLKAIREDVDTSWMGQAESWSLGGEQGKFALSFHDGTWCECLGSSPTTHIFKNGVVGFRLQALNEYVCMRTAQRSGIPTASVSYRFFGDEPALIVERYDRVRMQDGTIERLHQEDLCQSLSVMPNQKYTADGGPTAHDILNLLAHTSNRQLNLQTFTQILFFNYLIGAPHAHAKNYSVLLGNQGAALLARMYDVASALPYEGLRHKGRLAMAIGGENRFGRVGSGAIHRYLGNSNPKLAAALEKAGFTETFCLECMADLAQRIPTDMAAVFDETVAEKIPGADELRERLLGPVEKSCKATLALL